MPDPLKYFELPPEEEENKEDLFISKVWKKNKSRSYLQKMKELETESTSLFGAEERN